MAVHDDTCPEYKEALHAVIYPSLTIEKIFAVTNHSMPGRLILEGADSRLAGRSASGQDVQALQQQDAMGSAPHGSPYGEGSSAAAAAAATGRPVSKRYFNRV